MKAEAKSFKFLVHEGKVKIPFFQRTYVWGEDNWDSLLSELSNKTKGHFLGSIILKQLSTSSGESKQLEVVDGQQRLTTLSVLLKVLYDSFSSEIKEKCENEILQILYYRNDYTSTDYKIKIEHSKVDADAYEKVINIKDNSLIDLNSVNEKSHKIYQCYKYFLKILQNKSEDERKNLLNKILNTENKMLIVIDLVETTDDEQSIFDTLNTAGVRLSPAEIIKNALFQKVIKVSEDKDFAIDLYNKTWDKTFLSNEDTVTYWETERLTGRLKRDNIDILLHCIAVIKGFFEPDKHTLSDLSKLYKEEIVRKNSIEELKAFINEIIEYANIYRERFPTFDKSTLLSNSDPINRLFHIVEVLEISTFHPFILFVFKNYHNDKSGIENMLANLEKFIVRRMIAQQETKNYNKNCKEFITKTDSLFEKLKETTAENISNGLRRISNKNATLLLFWVELHRRKLDKKYDTDELKYTYSLEHIMPQKWEEHWKEIPDKYNADGSKMTDEDAKKDRNNKVFWIGNMTLLKTTLNSALRNYPFNKKMDGKERVKGIKAYADLSITKDDICTPYEKGDDVWDENKIIKRTENINKEFNQIWGNI